MKTAAAYIRVSTEDQIEYSPESQRKKLLEYLFIYDLKPVEIAGLLGCSVDYVYHLKRYTLSTLRKALLEDEHEL